MRNNIVSSDLICKECGTKMVIPRHKNSMREKYHIKDIYCYNCDKATKHIEVYELDILKKELEYKDELDDTEKLIYNLINIEEGKNLCLRKNI